MRAGRVGFQREMNALSSLKAPDSAEAQNVQALLKSTHEIELRVQQINRWWRLWRPDVRQGWAMLARFRVGFPTLHSRACWRASGGRGGCTAFGGPGNLVATPLHSISVRAAYAALLEGFLTSIHISRRSMQALIGKGGGNWMLHRIPLLTWQ